MTLSGGDGLSTLFDMAKGFVNVVFPSLDQLRSEYGICFNSPVFLVLVSRAAELKILFRDSNSRLLQPNFKKSDFDFDSDSMLCI